MYIRQPLLFIFFLFTITGILLSSKAIAQSNSNAKVWYLGSNGWAVQINEKLLIFDYQEYSDPNPLSSGETRNLERGYINPDELRPIDVYVFVTHSHQDHFDPVIFDWQEQIDNITYIFGWKANEDPGHHYLTDERASKEIDDMKVYTIYSHHAGVPEVAFMVMVDGYTIYHNGDYMAEYQQDYRYLKSIADHIDLAFVIGHAVENHQYFLQTKYLDELFHHTYIFPMNREGQPYRCHDFANLLMNHDIQSEVIVMEERGDSYICPQIPN